MMAIASNTAGFRLCNSGLYNALSIIRSHSRSGFTVTFRSLEYTHRTEVPTGHTGMTNAMQLFRNCRKLSYKDNGSFTLLEVLIIARDFDNIKRFYKVGLIKAGEHSKQYREHVWKLLTTEPRLIFKTKLCQANKELVYFVRLKIFSLWSPYSHARFAKSYVHRRQDILMALTETCNLPREVLENVVTFVPHWE